MSQSNEFFKDVWRQTAAVLLSFNMLQQQTFMVLLGIDTI